MKTLNASAKTEKRDFWANHVKQYAISGKTLRAYCQQHHLKLHQLTYWRRIFSDQPNTRESNSNKTTVSGFVGVQVSQPTETTTQTLIVELPSGVRIKGIHPDNLNIIQEIIRWQT